MRFLFFWAALLLPLAVAAQTPGSIVAQGAIVLPAPPLMEHFVKITAAQDMSFGLRPDGRVVGWGSDGLGLMDIVDPTTAYLDVSVGYLHVLLLHADGSIDAYSGPDTWFPLTPPAPNLDYVAVSAGTQTSAALRDDGTVEIWGALRFTSADTVYTAVAAGAGTVYGLDEFGSIHVWGSGTYGQHAVPAPNSGFVALSAGERFALALRDDGSIAVWGRNDFGQVSLPTPNSGIQAVAAGSRHALILRDDGSIEAWGENTNGQTDLPSPNSGFARIAGGFNHSVAVRDDGELVAWGKRRYGVCGVYPPNAGFLAVDSDLALRDDGSLWLYLDGIAPPDAPTPNSGFVQIERLSNYTYALRGTDGSIAAWGDNYDGQLNVPAPNSGFVAMESGVHFGIALRDNGRVECWGDNWHGQMNIPEPDATYLAVAAGSHHNAAIRADGSVSVWGNGMPVPAPTDTGYVAVAAGRYHTMALHEDGHIAVWSQITGPEAVPAPNAGFVAIHAEEKTCIAQREDGTLVAWGDYTWDDSLLFDGSTRMVDYRVWSNVVFGVQGISTTTVDPGLPPASGLVLGALPNPFNPTLTVWFTAPRAERATIDVFDLKGRRVRSLWRGELEAGRRRSVVWDGRDETGIRVASGTYLVKLQGERGDVTTRSVSLVK